MRSSADGAALSIPTRTAVPERISVPEASARSGVRSWAGGWIRCDGARGGRHGRWRPGGDAGAGERGRRPHPYGRRGRMLFLPARPGGPRSPAGSPGVWRESPAVPSARWREAAVARAPAARPASRHRIAAAAPRVHAPPSPKTVLLVPSASGHRCGPEARSNPWVAGSSPGGGGGPARVRPIWRTTPGESRRSVETAGTAVRWELRLPGARSRDTSEPGRNSRSPLLRELA
jgi:hypothetical protein